MIGLGTIVNAGAVIIGGLIGLLLKGGLKQRFQDILMQVLGLSVVFIGIQGVMEGIASMNSILIILSLVFGALLGEWINIEKRTQDFGEWLKRKVKSEKDNKFVEGFVSTSFTICIGAMAIVGSLQDGLTGNANMLYQKAILDAVFVIIAASAFGKGPIFSVIPVVILQGSITLLAKYIEPFLTDAVISNLSVVGSMLIFCVGVNLMFPTKIKVANMLPCLLFVIIGSLFCIGL